jgi:hypothetical protein
MTEVRITDDVDDNAVAELRERVISYNLTATGFPTVAPWAVSSETPMAS